MPSVPRSQLYRGTPYLLDTVARHSIGWRDNRKDGPSFVVTRLGPLDSVKVKQTFPLTEQGWASAWRALVGVDPGAAQAVAATLARRDMGARAAAALADLDAQSLSCLRRVTFTGGSGDLPLAKGQACDLRFLRDRIMVTPPGSPEAIVEVPYRDAETVEIGGTGQDNKPTGELLALILGLALIGALLGLFVLGLLGLLLGALLFGLIGALAGASSTKAEAMVRICRSDGDLHFLYFGKRPDALRTELSEPLAAVRRACAEPADDTDEPAQLPPGSIPDQLTKLASLLQQGLINRDEFEHLKAKLIASP